MADLYRQGTNSEEREFQEQIKSPILLDAVLVQFKDKATPSIFKDDFTLKTDPSIFTLKVPELLNDQKRQTEPSQKHI